MLAYAIDNYKAVTAITKRRYGRRDKGAFRKRHRPYNIINQQQYYSYGARGRKFRDLKIETSLPEYMAAPVNEGDKIGTVNVVLNGEVVGSGDLIADFSVKRHPLDFLCSFLVIYGVFGS